MKLFGPVLFPKLQAGGGEEPGIIPSQKNIEIVKQLTDRGIMNSICSKNDFEQAKEKLQELGIWDYFIFPHICRNSKGQEIKELINSANLRDENTLFIDDNHLNLEEAKFYCKNIKTAFPDVIENLLSYNGLKGKDDINHSRLKQYKVLETKYSASKKFDNNLDFLKQSNINVKTEILKSKDFERVLEMINRTNQLNFTKKRIDKNELENLTKNSEYENKIVYVSDKYGDYGLAGFYSYNKEKHYLEHFLFSCRILNLGVEQWIYSKLKFPQIEIKEPVSAVLNKETTPNWIHNNYKKQKTKKEDKNKIKILLIGQCDLYQIMSNCANKNLKYKYNLDYSENTFFRFRWDDIFTIENSKKLDDETKEKLYKKYPFIEAELFNNPMFREEYDILAFSLMFNYCNKIYKDKETGVILPSIINEFKTNFFEDDEEECYKELSSRGIKCSLEEIKTIKKSNEAIGYLNKELLQEKLEFILKNTNKPIFFINGPETEFPKDTKEKTERFIALNAALDEFIAAHKNCYLIDVRKYVKSADNMTDSKTHYKRNIYHYLGNDIETLTSKILNCDIGKTNFFAMYLKRIKFNLTMFRRKIIWFRFKKNERFIRVFGKDIYGKSPAIGLIHH